MEKIKSFNGIRVIAFMMIFFSHLGRFFTIVNDFGFGVIGSQMFFILSGFLCLYNYRGKTQGILRESWIYYLKKLKKIYPLHLVTFLIAASLQLWWAYKFSSTSGLKLIIISAIPNLLLIQTFFRGMGGVYNFVAWFLADIMFCYLLTPTLVRLTKRCCYKNQIFISLFVIFLIQIIAAIICPVGDEQFIIYTFPLSRILDFEIGILFGQLFLITHKNHNKVLLYQGMSIISLFLLMILSYMFKIDMRYKYVVLFEFSICLIIYFTAMDSRGWISSFLCSPLMGFLSSISMEFFLIHQLAIRLITEFDISFKILNSLEYYICCFVISLSLSILWKGLVKLFSMQ